MNKYKLETGALNTNTYVNLDYVRDEQELFNVFNQKEIDSNIYDTDQFVKDLIECESGKVSRRKDSSINYGAIFTFLLEKEQQEQELVKLSDKIGGRFDNLPYYSYLKQVGQGNYLVVYVCERHYDPDGMSIQKIASKDIYKDSITHRYCDKESPNAELIYTVGDLMGTIVSKFTAKNRKFTRFSGKYAFLNFMNELKEWYMTICEKIFQAAVNVGISFKRFATKYLNKREKARARLWHNAFNVMEQRFSTLYMSLTCGDTERLSDKEKRSLDSVFRQYNRKIKESYKFISGNRTSIEVFNNGTESFYISLDNQKTIKKNSKMLIESFNRALNNIYHKFMEC